ncbi:hypothetical protein HDE_06676 [Halotydeus destructor]|nr:hypothetical protein HDE_06676 [Halotydeus destructor]
MGNTNRYRQDVLREQQLVTSMSSCSLASCNHTLPNSQVIQGPSSNHQDRLQGAPWLPPATGHEGHPVDHCCCMQGCHTGTSGPVPLASSWPVYATEGSYTRPPSQGWPRPGPSHSGSQASLVHCCSATSTHGSSPAPSCSLPSTPGSPSSASSGPGMALETLWEETGQVASQPAAVAVAMETIESPTIQMLQLKIRQLSSMVTSRDMEISRLKMALYTINAFGEEAKPPPGPSSNKGWLSKLGMNSSKSTAKPATRWRKGNQ